MSQKSSQPLPAKEGAHFKSIMRLYEAKQHKKVVKLADQILKKYPEHGETLSMKGLAMSNMDKKDQAYELCKKGLRCDVKSQVCWHALGILYRQDKDYQEAAKCYRQALRIEPENFTIMRDLSNLQIHIRQLEGFRETRRKLLSLKPALRFNWTTFALAHHLCGSLDAAVGVLEEHEKTFKDDSESIDAYDAGEVSMYKAMVLEESGRYEEAIDYLTEQLREGRCPDKVGYYETVGRLSLYLRNFDDAHAAYTHLFKACPEHEDYALGLQAATVQLHDISPPPPPPGDPVQPPDSKKKGRAKKKVREALPNGPQCEQPPPALAAKECDNLSYCLPTAPPAASPQSMVPPPTPSTDAPAPDSDSQRDASGQGSETSGHSAPTPFSVGRIRLFSKTIHPLGKPLCGWLEAPSELLEGGPGRRGDGGEGLDGTDDIHHRPHWKRRKAVSGRRFECVGRLTDEQQERVCGFYDALRQQYPKSDVVRRLPLYFTEGDRFAKRLDEYLRPRIRKGIPSLFNLLKCFYTPEKGAFVEQLLTGYLRSLEATPSTFGPPAGLPTDAGDANNATPKEELPLSYLFTLTILAQHADYMGRTSEALEWIDKAIQHTPTLVDLYSIKARICKHAGAFERASELAEEARQLDLADRFLNTKSVKYLLRINKTQQALSTALLFSKEQDSDATPNLFDMQCMWFEYEIGRAYRRVHDYARALKNFHRIVNHLNDFREDQFDFHGYCQRKMSNRTYLSFLRMEDRLYSHKFFRRAAKQLIDLYLFLHSEKGKPGASESSEAPKAEEEALTPAERKRLKNKLKKEAKKAEASSSAAEEKTATTTQVKSKRRVDDDPHGAKLIEKDPIEEATKIAATLQEHCSLDPTTHALAYRLHKTRRMPLLQLRALRRLWELCQRDPFNHKLAPLLADFTHNVCVNADQTNTDAPPPSPAPSPPPGLSDEVRSVLVSELAPLLPPPFLPAPSAASDGGGMSVDQLRDAGARFATAAAEKLGAAPSIKMKRAGLCVLRNGGARLSGDSALCKGILETLSPRDGTLRDCIKMLEFLQAEPQLQSYADTFKSSCHALYPLADFFQPSPPADPQVPP
ncbi:unnamed protein product [Vitrella brassicaformis CCMP3155]|uniref:Uncharacterized protein n=1 Tax=Vitrella brassicaformis (strain CCMP3155) TaxID=1169540 RepID=A0A0G4E8A8_VITBC|nr:unnamed protein product [Vitrella brassicaformis CCMP3155]|eukprot:CEL91625.1 unnamed protein product [Vitrella brassicaformis CCMP3155]